MTLYIIASAVLILGAALWLAIDEAKPTDSEKESDENK